jgi:twitching motility protein PilT
VAIGLEGLGKILKVAVQNRVSDIHLAVGEVPGLRLNGSIVDLKHPPITHEDMHSIVRAICHDQAAKENPALIKDFDGSFEAKGIGRFRYNIFSNRAGLGVIFRSIPEKIPSIDEMGLPQVLKKVAHSGRGLVLVTGATGSGKSSTLAAIVNHINETKSEHILTIEDPIEYVHTRKKSRISQREIGRNSESFAKALKSALRQDPDVILVGEMRDIETVEIALKAAETGHLVLSTVHTTDAIKTIGRLISLFPAEEQHMVRLRLAENLKATVSQRLLKRKDNKGRVAALEVMLVTPTISECIADSKRTGEIPGYIEQGRENYGSQTFDQHIADHYLAGLIDIDTAKAAATSASDLERNLMYGAKQSDDVAKSISGTKVDLELPHVEQKESA